VYAQESHKNQSLKEDARRLIFVYHPELQRIGVWGLGKEVEVNYGKWKKCALLM
jgi:hypothetical protein